jgi:hypothetical protein
VKANASIDRAAGRRDHRRAPVQLCHPLLRSVVLDRTPLADRVQVYQALARASHGSLRAWYLAAAATGPDEAAAGALVAAAEDARRRSGYGAAARAWRRAAELSVATHDRVIRLLHAANDGFVADDSDSAVTWCEEALRDCREPGPSLRSAWIAYAARSQTTLPATSDGQSGLGRPVHALLPTLYELG